MGYISLIQIWNDELSRIKEDPQKWVEELVAKLGGLPQPGDKIPGGKILRCEHSDYDTLHVIGSSAAAVDHALISDLWDSIRDEHRDESAEQRQKAKQIRILRKAAEKLGFALTPTEGDSPLLGLTMGEKQNRMEQAGFAFKALEEDGKRGYAMFSPRAPFRRIAVILKVRGGWEAHLDLQVHDGQIRIPQGGKFKTLREAKKAVYAHSDGILKDLRVSDLIGLTKLKAAEKVKKSK